MRIASRDEKHDEEASRLPSPGRSHRSFRSTLWGRGGTRGGKDGAAPSPVMRDAALERQEKLTEPATSPDAAALVSDRMESPYEKRAAEATKIQSLFRA